MCVSYLHTLSILSLITGYPDISILMRQRGSNPFEFGLPGYLSPGLPHLLVEEQCHIGFCRHLLPQRCDSARENEGPGTLRNKKWFLCGSCLMIYMIDMIYSRYQRFWNMDPRPLHVCIYVYNNICIYIYICILMVSQRLIINKLINWLINIVRL